MSRYNQSAIAPAFDDITESWKSLHRVYVDWSNRNAVPTPSQIGMYVGIGFREIESTNKTNLANYAYNYAGLACLTVEKGVSSNHEAVTPLVVRKATRLFSSSQGTFHGRARQTMGAILNAALANVAPENQKLDESQKISLLESMQEAGRYIDISKMPNVFDRLIDLALFDASPKKIRLNALAVLRNSSNWPESELRSQLTQEQIARLLGIDFHTHALDIVNSVKEIRLKSGLNAVSNLLKSSKFTEIMVAPVFPKTKAAPPPAAQPNA